MYPRIPQPLTRTVIRTKSPIKTPTKPDAPLKNIETPQSKNKLHSSLSSHSPTPTKSHLSSSASKPKNPSEVLKNWYASNSSVTVYSKTPVRSNISPIKGMSTEPDMREYKSLTTRSPNKSPLRMQQTAAGPSDFFEGQENLNYLSQSSRKGDNFASTSRERENNRSVGLSDYESENLKKHLNSDMRISLGNYVLQKLTGRVLKKAAMKKLIENMEHKKAGLQDKILKLMALAAEAEAEKKEYLHFQSEKKDRKKAHDELFDEEILTETGTQNSSDRKHVEPAKTLLDKYKSQKMSKGQSHSALPTESVSTERSSRTAEDWAELFLKKVEMDTKKEKNTPMKQDSAGNGRVQTRKLRDTAKAAIVIQRAFRRYVKRIKKDQMQTTMQKQPAKVEKVNIQGKQCYSSAVERELSSSGIVEQLTTELELAKKKNAYLQKENENLEEKVKKLEGDIERRVNERLTIERARIKDTLSEYSTFIDKLLSEKKQLEEKTASQAQLITELCARLENKTTAIEKQQSTEEHEDNRGLGEYNSILKEKEALKTKLSARVLEPLIDFNTSKRVDENKQAFHKGSFGATDEKVNFHSVPNDSNFVKPLPELHFSPQIPKTDSRKNSEQSQAESAKFMHNSYNQESSSLLTDKKNQDFMFMSVDTRSARQIQEAKVKRNKSAERDVKSAREALEFSFEAKADAKDDEEDFSEPFVLSVALQDKSLKKTLSARSVSQEPKQSQESQSGIAKSDTKKSVMSEKETKISRDRLQMARIEKRKAKEQTEEEGLVPELENLIANLSKRLYIEEGNEGEKNVNTSGNPTISKSSSSDLHSEGVESMKTENIFQKLSRSHQKG